MYLKIELSFLDSDKSYKATIYRDPIDGGWEEKPEEIIIDNIIVNKKSTYKLILPSGGGQAIKFSQQSEGWPPFVLKQFYFID